MENVICSTDERDEIDALQEDNSRKEWGEKLPGLFRTPTFQQELEDIGGPMFWAPLISVPGYLPLQRIFHWRDQPRARETSAGSENATPLRPWLQQYD